MKADLGGHLINNQLDTKARTANRVGRPASKN
jgi:hypothetical protein